MSVKQPQPVSDKWFRFSAFCIFMPARIKDLERHSLMMGWRQGFYLALRIFSSSTELQEVRKHMVYI